MSNPFYTPTGNPQTLSRGASAILRAEFASIQAGFALIASVAGLNSAVDTSLVANTIVVAPSPAITAYVEFQQIMFLAANSNTGATTINANGLGAANLKRKDNSALQAGDILANGIYTAIYDGTEFQLQSTPIILPLTLNNNSIAGAKNISYNIEYDNGSSGTGTVSVAWANGQNQKVTLTGTCTVAIGIPPGVGHYQLRVIENATGAFTITWSGISSSRWLGATTSPPININANGETIVNFFYDGTNITQSLSRTGEL